MVTGIAALEGAADWLRPLVKTKAWDYCIIWKLGGDPLRFIEWGACCCSVGNGEPFKLKEEIDVGKDLNVECKDSRIRHPVRTKACRALAKFPSSIGLYSGIHGEVVISKQPKWLTLANASISNSSPEAVGTQVLIPVAGGLIELFSAKNVPKSQKTVDLISARFKISLEQENMIEKGYINFNLREQICYPYLNNNQNDWLPSLHYTNLFPPAPLSNISSSIEGSSTVSNEIPSLNMYPDNLFGRISPTKSTVKYSEMPSSNLKLKRKQSAAFSLGSSGEKENAKNRQSAEKEHYQSKNLITERNRRKRIKDGLFALRSLVPKISKMDRAAILGDAVEYIKELEETIEKYRDELRGMEDDNSETYAKNSIKHHAGHEYLPKADINRGNFSPSDKNQIEVEVEVSQIGTKAFLLRCTCAKKRGGFVRLMEAMESLGLKVVDANVTTLNGSVLNILTVEANKREIEQKSLKQFLIQHVINWTTDDQEKLNLEI